MKRGNVKNGIGPVFKKRPVKCQGERPFMLQGMKYQTGHGHNTQEDNKEGGAQDHCVFFQAVGAFQSSNAAVRHELGRFSCKPGVIAHQNKGKSDLKQRQNRGQRQVEHVGGLTVNFRFNGGKGRPAQYQDNAEAGKAENKDQCAGSQNRRFQQGEGDIKKALPRIGSQCLCGFIHFSLETGPEAGDNPHHDTEVVKHMGQENQGQRMMDAKVSQQPFFTEAGLKGCGNDNGR